MSPVRTFHQRHHGDLRQLEAALCGVWATEVLAPSAAVWLIAPRLANVAVLDNRAGEYGGIDPAWTWREIRLFDCLGSLLGAGSEIRIKTAPADQNRAALEELHRRGRDLGAHDGLHVRLSEQLGSQGLLTSRCAVRGELLRPSGYVFDDDSIVTYSIDPGEVSAMGATLQAEW